MGKKIVIVESPNDKYFIEAFVDAQSINTDIESSAFCQVDDYECMGGDSVNKLKTSLSSIKNRARKEEIAAIGIILDQDNKAKEERIQQVNEAIKEVFEVEDDQLIEDLGKYIEAPVDKTINIRIGLYLQNIDNQGNLETVLKTIKNKDSVHADCLEAWKKCLEAKELKISDPDFDKFWVQIYQRYDQCNKKERKQAGRKCNNEESMKKDIWNYSHKSLDNLASFLNDL